MKNSFNNLINYLYFYLENKRITKELENRNLKWLGSVNDEKNYINAFIDFSNSRSTYDLIGFLVYLASISKINKQKVRLIILPEENLRNNWAKEKDFLDNESTHFRHNFISKQLINLIEDFNPQVVFFDKREEAFNYLSLNEKYKFPKFAEPNKLIDFDDYYLFINEFYKKNKFICSLKAPKYISKFIEKLFRNIDTKKGIVTITLRNSSYTMIRNSDSKNWINFFYWLKERDYYPVVINDTEKININNYILHDGNKIPTFDLASINCDIRMGLYEKAYLNTGVGTGPTLLLNFSKYCNYLLFKTYVDEDCSASLDSFKKICGFGKGEQWPFANNLQKLVWDTGDDFNLLKKEFINMEKLLKKNV